MHLAYDAHHHRNRCFLGRKVDWENSIPHAYPSICVPIFLLRTSVPCILFNRKWFLRIAAHGGLIFIKKSTTIEYMLSNKNRNAIYRYISKYPGAHFSRIKRELGLSAGTVTHHTRKLEDMEMIKSHMKGCKKCFYPNGMKIEEDTLTSVQSVVAKYISNKPGRSTTEIAAHFGISRRAVSYHTNDLHSLGIIKRKKRGNVLYWYPGK